MREIIYTEDQINEVALQLSQQVPSKALCFYGPMGAGKTTLIKALVKQLGGAGAANSPTFGIVNEYHTNNGELLAYHFDFYRLNDEIEALDLGIEDYFNSEAWLFMEWPEKIANILPSDGIRITIEVINSETRKLYFPSKS
ncbi:MAG: tRNA (adenosine(37)-N6)-threonylcarbamoyltransferase complex ATPase subunit type 1 TsaE [Maribacter sp.]|nr:tRNA (adenosine(37)-N6)-threonylcarbamoyltransferase complex ATPase subunit type 1 TsaE [Maribacter sp.]